MTTNDSAPIPQPFLHELLTCVRAPTVALSARDGQIRDAVDVSAVTFSPLSSAEISAYVATGEPRDKAGAYAIQGWASRFVERLEGSYSGVVGLPVAVAYRLLIS